MHYAGSYRNIPDNFVHFAIGTKLPEFCGFSIIKHTFPLERNRCFHH